MQAKAAQQEAAAQRKADWLAAHLRGEPLHYVDEEQHQHHETPHPSSTAGHQPPMSLAARLRPHGRRALTAPATNTSTADHAHGDFGHDRHDDYSSPNWHHESSFPDSNSSKSNWGDGDFGSSNTTVGRYLKAWPASASETGIKQPRTRSSQSSRAVSGSQGDQEGKSIKPRLDLMLRADKEKRLEKKERKEVL